MKLYELSNDFAELFDNFDAIAAMTFSKNEKVEFIDDDGNVIPDLEAVRGEILEAWFDTLNGIEGEFERKAENVGAYIKQLKAEQEALAAEKKRLEARMSAKKNQSERLQSYLLAQMQKINLKNIDMPKCKITVSNGAGSLFINDEAAFATWATVNDHEDLLKYTDPVPQKDVIKKLIKAGEDIPYTEIIKTPHITVK